MTKEERYLKLLRKLLVVINPVTAYHRHHNVIPKARLDNLSNLQIEIEKELKILEDE